MSNRRNLSQASDEILTRLADQPKSSDKVSGHDVAHEPRVPAGNRGRGQWTKGGPHAPAESVASVHGNTVTIIHADGAAEIRNGGTVAWRNNTPQAQQSVRNISGLPGTAVIKNLNPREKQQLYIAIRRNEGWRSGAATSIGRE